MMLDPLNLSAALFTAYLLVAARVFGVFATMPLFGDYTVPWQTKAGISLLTAYLLLPAAQMLPGPPPDSMLLLGAMIVRELVVGILIGFAARLMFGAFQFAVAALDYQTGLSFMELVNAAAEANLSVLGQFLNTFVLLLFLELEGHHMLLRALAATIDVLPLGAGAPLDKLVPGILSLFAMLVAFALQIAIPTVVILVLIDLAMGIVGRVVPQLNVFLVAFPVKIMIAMGTLAAALPLMAGMVGRLLATLGDGLAYFVQVMR